MHFVRREMIWINLFLLVGGLWSAPAWGELNPGDILGKANCAAAKDLLPERVRQGYCSGEYPPVEILDVPDTAYRYSQKFTAASEANAGKYYVTPQGALYETATQTWPQFWYGFPFPTIDPQDPYAGEKVMYNHQIARFQIDDVYWFLALKWANPDGFERAVEYGYAGTWFIGRHSGPIENPDETYLKGIRFGVAPYDLVGVASLEWWPTDPERWPQLWNYVPVLRRVRRTAATNTSEGIFGSTIARDDLYGWGGKIPTMHWRLLRAQDVLVPIAPSGLERLMTPGEPAPKQFVTNPDLIADRGSLPPGHVARLTFSDDERVKVGYETGRTGEAAWWPTNIKLAKRRCWVVEATPKDAYYAYGRRIVYIDQTSYWPYWGEVYSQAGEYWKTFLYLDILGYTPGRQMTVRHSIWGVGIDHLQNRATMADTQSKGYFTEYELGFANSTYTTQSLSALGK